ncbi:MAG TPA: chlorite dismutase family protein [Polyangiaceae bacterium]|nr:chlorite dismutase family protein [Polyangiaceae bacterium]
MAGRNDGSHDGTDALDLRERGAPIDGAVQYLDQRTFMQLLVIEAPTRGPDALDPLALGERLVSRGVTTVIYEDVNHPARFGVLTASLDPSAFVVHVRPQLRAASLTVHDEFTMLGRAYSTGYEQDLEYWMVHRPLETVTNPAWPWAVWYPLRRKGAFERLEPRDKGGILREHAEIGKRYGSADFAHDVRLACHGLDPHDNDFVIGLIGKELHPLSHVVQTMRGTRQTSEYIEKLGPFFVGRAVFQRRPA